MEDERLTTDKAKVYRDAFGHVHVSDDGRWTCYVTGLSAPCGCFACNASARKALDEIANAIKDGKVIT